MNRSKYDARQPLVNFEDGEREFLFPVKVVASRSVVMMPSSILLPYALCANVNPRVLARSATMLATVVLPFVPVTAMILSGFSIRMRKSGHSFLASCPGK